METSEPQVGAGEVLTELPPFRTFEITFVDETKTTQVAHLMDPLSCGHLIFIDLRATGRVDPLDGIPLFKRFLRRTVAAGQWRDVREIFDDEPVVVH